MDHDGRKRLPHELPSFVNPETAVFFLTICAKKRAVKTLIQFSIPGQLLDSIRHYHRSGNWWIHLAMIMPDPIHLLASFTKPMTKTVFDWKQWTSRHLGVIWQREFFEHRLRSEGDCREKADYILMNPVRAGLVEDWPDWPHRWIPED